MPIDVDKLNETEMAKTANKVSQLGAKLDPSLFMGAALREQVASFGRAFKGYEQDQLASLRETIAAISRVDYAPQFGMTPPILEIGPELDAHDLLIDTSDATREALAGVAEGMASMAAVLGRMDARQAKMQRHATWQWTIMLVVAVVAVVVQLIGV